jgi:hypothetical protein
MWISLQGPIFFRVCSTWTGPGSEQQDTMCTTSRFGLVLLAGLCTVAPARAGSWADGLFSELSKDFGSVARGPMLSHPFRVVNHTKGPVNLSGVRVSCNACSSAAISGKTYLNPGEETAVVVKLDTTRFTGVKTITVFVTFDRPEAQEVRLWVQANSRNDFTVTPDTLSFGQVKRGAAPATAARITFYGITNAQILEAQAESNYIKAELKEVRRENSEVAYEMTARLRADTPVGKWYSDVWLKTNITTMPQIRVPLTMEIEAPLSVSPEAVTLGQLKAGAEGERRVIVRGVKPFTITKVEGTGDDLTVQDSARDSKAVHVLTVKLKADQPGDVNRTLRVLTDLAEDGAIQFQVSAQVLP